MDGRAGSFRHDEEDKRQIIHDRRIRKVRITLDKIKSFQKYFDKKAKVLLNSLPDTFSEIIFSDNSFLVRRTPNTGSYVLNTGQVPGKYLEKEWSIDFTPLLRPMWMSEEWEGGGRKFLRDDNSLFQWIQILFHTYLKENPVIFIGVLSHKPNQHPMYVQIPYATSEGSLKTYLEAIEIGVLRLWHEWKREEGL